MNQKNPSEFFCEKCDYLSCRKSQYIRHLSTTKHKMIVNSVGTINKPPGIFECICGKTYKYDSGYYRHKKTCDMVSAATQNSASDTEETAQGSALDKPLENTVIASSKYGVSLASSASTGVTATTVPQAPTIDSVTGGDAQVSVAFTAGATGGSAITGYTVTSSPGSLTASGASSPLVVTGLTNGTAYTFTAVATNANGTSSASTASSSVTPIVSGDYVSIATTTVGSGGAANVEFTSIPASFTHLQVRGIARSNGTLDGFTARFNSDTNSNYTRHRVYGNGANVPADGNAPRTNITLADGALPGTGSNIFAPVVFDIVDYANSNKYKTLRSLGGTDNNGSGTIWLNSGSWMSTSAITSIKIEPGDGSWVQYTEFALYGIKGA